MGKKGFRRALENSISTLKHVYLDQYLNIMCKENYQEATENLKIMFCLIKMKVSNFIET